MIVALVVRTLPIITSNGVTPVTDMIPAWLEDFPQWLFTVTTFFFALCLFLTGVLREWEWLIGPGIGMIFAFLAMLLLVGKWSQDTSRGSLICVLFDLIAIALAVAATIKVVIPKNIATNFMYPLTLPISRTLSIGVYAWAITDLAIDLEKLVIYL